MYWLLQPAPPVWTYNEFFDLLHRSMTSSTMIPMSVPFSIFHTRKVHNLTPNHSDLPRRVVDPERLLRSKCFAVFRTKWFCLVEQRGARARGERRAGRARRVRLIVRPRPHLYRDSQKSFSMSSAVEAKDPLLKDLHLNSSALVSAVWGAVNDALNAMITIRDCRLGVLYPCTERVEVGQTQIAVRCSPILTVVRGGFSNEPMALNSPIFPILTCLVWKRIGAAVVRKKCKIEGEHTVNKQTAQRWFNRLNSEDFMLLNRALVVHLHVILRLHRKQWITELVPALADRRTPLDLLKTPYIAACNHTIRPIKISNYTGLPVTDSLRKWEALNRIREARKRLKNFLRFVSRQKANRGGCIRNVSSAAVAWSARCAVSGVTKAGQRLASHDQGHPAERSADNCQGRTCRNMALSVWLWSYRNLCIG
ncbi:hypothetical protein EVAR_33630_1 [Eumeta japonica]|uniref:Uncharacterized protein n=1 Tax=Eumeta variegata TaxID=151549 RepID=A0A4C1WA33_EUMVA|nr:hypothetical protein EVAR_33630_1 [Eumeta japonica]